MAGQRMLVTGGTGVIGAWVVRGLLHEGHEPVVFSRGETDAIGGTINADVQSELRQARGDMLDRASVERAIRANDIDVIVHMASAKPWQIERPFVERSDPRAAIEQITLGTLNVLDAACTTGVGRVVHASSKAVFGDIGGRHGPPTYDPLPDDHPRVPRMLYGVGKLAAEDLGRYYAEHEGLEFCSIRFSSSYGPLKRGPTAVALEGALLAARDGEPVRLRPFVDGQIDDYAYNKDVASAFVGAALASGPLHWTYNVGSGRGIDHHDIARAIRHHFPDADIDFLDSEAVRREGLTIMDRARCVMDISRPRVDFGYEPRFVALEDAFADFLVEEARMGGGVHARH